MSAIIHEFPGAFKPVETLELPPPKRRVSRIWLGFCQGAEKTAIPHPDLYPQGRFEWVLDSGEPFTLGYEITPAALPEWWAENLENTAPGEWYTLTINDCDGRGLPGIMLRVSHPRNRPEPYCPACNRSAKAGFRRWDNRLVLNLETWAIGCSECQGFGDNPDLIEARPSPPRRTARTRRCDYCGYPDRAPIHNKTLMKGNALFHEFVAPRSAS